MSKISVETSLTLFIFLPLFFSLVEKIIWRRNIAVQFTFVVCSFFIILHQIQYNTFNLLTWAADIPEPHPNTNQVKNAHTVIKNNIGTPILTRWSTVDRIDILRLHAGGLLAYANNTAWTEIAIPDLAEEPFPYFRPTHSIKKVLSLGAGGGVDLITAKRLMATKIVAVELNYSLVHLLKNELHPLNKDLFLNVDYRAEDARFFLEKNTDKFDLITNKYTDTRSKSDRYFTSHNLLRTSNTIQNMITHLSPTGFCLWAMKMENTDIEPAALNTLSALQESMSQQGKKLREHLVIIRQNLMSPNELPGAKLYHIIFSKQLVTKSLITATFEFNQEFEIVFPNYKKNENDALVKIFEDLGGGDKKMELEDYMVLTDNKPIERNEKSIHFVFVNILICLLAVLLLSIGFLWRTHQRIRGSTNTAGLRPNLIYLATLCTGFAYGLLQTAIVQEMEYYMAQITIGYGLMLSLFLFSGSIASFISPKLTLSICKYLYLLLPAGSLIFAIHTLTGNSPFFWVVISITGCFYLLCISLLFPKLLDLIKHYETSEVGTTFCGNLISMALGSFVFCLLFLLYERSKVMNYVFFILTISTLLVTLLLKRVYKIEKNLAP